MDRELPVLIQLVQFHQIYSPIFLIFFKPAEIDGECLSGDTSSLEYTVWHHQPRPRLPLECDKNQSKFHLHVSTSCVTTPSPQHVTWSEPMWRALMVTDRL